jgi:acylglycerol lipase
MELSDAEFSLDYDGLDFKITLRVGVLLLGQLWKPPGDAPSFVMVFLHGLGAFITFKRDFFSVITANNGAVFACDHFGHGRSPGPRTSCTIEEIEEETIKVLELAHSVYPNVPIVLDGHSMCALATIFTALRSPDPCPALNLRSVIIEAPWLFQCPAQTIGLFEKCVVQLLEWIWPTFRLPKGANGITPDLDSRWSELVTATPMYIRSLTPRLFISAAKAQRFVQETINLWPPQLPLLFLQGGADGLADPIGNHNWITQFQSIAGHDVTYRQYPSGTHFLLKGPDLGSVIREILRSSAGLLCKLLMAIHMKSNRPTVV